MGKDENPNINQQLPLGQILATFPLFEQIPLANQASIYVSDSLIAPLVQKLQNDHNLKVPGVCRVKSISKFDEKIRINCATEDAGLKTLGVDTTEHMG